MNIYQTLHGCVGFDWDESNADKNLDRHGVTDGECEEVFFNDPLVAGDDPRHSQEEPRGYVLGRTNAGRHLFIVFTIRRRLVRVISARDMTTSEQERYER